MKSKLNQFLPFSCRKSNPPGRSPSRSTRSCSHLVKPVSQLAKPRARADSAIRPHLETTTWQQQRQRQQHERQNSRQTRELLQTIEKVSTRFEIRAEHSHWFISVRKVCCYYYFFLPDTLTEKRANARPRIRYLF